MFKKFIKYFYFKYKYNDSKIYLGATIDNLSSVGKYSVIFSNTALINSRLGDYSYVQKNSEIINTTIGKFCSLASNVTIGLANHPTHFVSTSPVFYDNTQPLPMFFSDKKYFIDTRLKTNIGADVWIGQSVIIKSGINIGVGAVIGAGAVVTKDVEPYSIVVGVPAKHIKFRFNPEIIIKLIESEWWMLSEVKLKKLVPYFNNPEELLNQVNFLE